MSYHFVQHHVLQAPSCGYRKLVQQLQANLCASCSFFQRWHSRRCDSFHSVTWTVLTSQWWHSYESSIHHSTNIFQSTKISLLFRQTPALAKAWATFASLNLLLLPWLCLSNKAKEQHRCESPLTAGACLQPAGWWQTKKSLDIYFRWSQQCAYWLLISWCPLLLLSVCCMPLGCCLQQSLCLPVWLPSAMQDLPRLVRAGSAASLQLILRLCRSHIGWWVSLQLLHFDWMANVLSDACSHDYVGQIGKALLSHNTWLQHFYLHYTSKLAMPNERLWHVRHHTCMCMWMALNGHWHKLAFVGSSNNGANADEWVWLPMSVMMVCNS